MRSSESRTKRAAVEAGLPLLIQTRAQTGIRRLRGKIAWKENLNKSRLGRTAEMEIKGSDVMAYYDSVITIVRWTG
jgi:hypothetical protein